MQSMRAIGVLIGFILIGTSTVGCRHFTAPPGTPVFLEVFDCLIPVPPGYAINTSDSSTTHAYTARIAEGRSDWGELIVWNYDGAVPRDRYEILSVETRGVLTIEEIRAHSTLQPPERRDSLIIITNGIRKLSLGGEAKRHADSMVDACLASLR